MERVANVQRIGLESVGIRRRVGDLIGRIRTGDAWGTVGVEIELFAAVRLGDLDRPVTDIFLVVEAAAIVAKSDWAECGEADKRFGFFCNFFSVFDELASGLGPLDRGAAHCVEALTVSNDS